MIFALLVSFSIESKMESRETVREKLKRLYKDHASYSYKKARLIMYNNVDCVDGAINLIYGGNTFNWTCGGSMIPPSKYANAEHTVPQSVFRKKKPMVSDLNHIFPVPTKLNTKRSYFKFGQFNFSEGKFFCKDFDCQTAEPSDPDEYSILSKSNIWMPKKNDRGKIARGLFYFFTMYDEYSISKVGEVETFKEWNKLFPPSTNELYRNNLVNETHGNRNPYIDDPSLVDLAW